MQFQQTELKIFGTHLSMDLHKIQKVRELGCFIILRGGSACLRVCVCVRVGESGKQNGKICTLLLIFSFSVDSETNIYQISLKNVPLRQTDPCFE